MFLYLRKHWPAFSPRLLGWKTYLFTLLYGVLQNVLLPLLIVAYTLWLVFSYPPEFVIAMAIVLYLPYLVLTLLLYLLVLLTVSERPKADLALAPWLPIYPVYMLIMRFICAFSILNEALRRGHEESSMAPWWVLKRGKKF